MLIRKSQEKIPMKKIIKSLVFLVLFACILLYPKWSLYYAATGLKLWFERMVPALFPFMILSGIMIRQNLSEGFAGIASPILGPLYKVSRNGVYCLLLGFLCGFPMGARTVAELYELKRINRREAEFLLSFCNNIGPVYYISFLLPVTGLSGSGKLPFFLFGMYGIPLLYGLFLRYTGFLLPGGSFGCLGSQVRKRQMQPEASAGEPEPPESFPVSLDNAMQSAISGITTLGGYMVLFNLFNLLPHAVSLFFHIPIQEKPLALLNCFLEITSGVSRLGSTAPFAILMLLPLGGLSCIAQTASMIKNTDLSLMRYLLHKLMQTGMTAGYYFLLRDFLF